MTELARISAKKIMASAPSFKPQFGIILGSGLGALATHLQDKKNISYQDLPGFPLRMIEGQQAELTLGYLNQVPVICLQGRAHYYEGWESKDILTYIRTLKLLDCHTLVITGAVGSLRTEIKPGQLVLLRDHINFQSRNPLVGVNDLEFGVRFPDMSEAYDHSWRQQFKEAARNLSIPLIEGVYMSVLGPSFETPAEVRLFGEIGADVVGMSVVSEVIAARHCGLRVIGLAVVTNLAAGLTVMPQTHEETIQIANKSTAQLIQLIQTFMEAQSTAIESVG